MAKMIFSSSEVDGMIRKMQTQKRIALHQASSVVGTQLNNVMTTRRGRNEYEVMERIYNQWWKMGKLLDAVFQQIDEGVKLGFKLAREARAAKDNDVAEQLWADRSEVSNRCYYLANRYLAGNKAFWDFKEAMLDIGKDPDTLQQVNADIQANPTWGIPAFLLDENVPAPGVYLPEEDEVKEEDYNPLFEDNYTMPTDIVIEDEHNKNKGQSIVTKEQPQVVKEVAAFMAGQPKKEQLLAAQTKEESHSDEQGEKLIAEVQGLVKKMTEEQQKREAVVKPIVSFFTKVKGNIFTTAAKVKDTVVSAAKTVVDTVIVAAKTVATTVKEKVTNFFSLVGSVFSNIFSSTAA